MGLSFSSPFYKGGSRGILKAYPQQENQNPPCPPLGKGGNMIGFATQLLSPGDVYRVFRPDVGFQSFFITLIGRHARKEKLMSEKETPSHFSLKIQ